MTAYEACRANHDFVVVEGTSLRGVGDDTITLNAKIAQTLGSSALLVTDAGIILATSRKVNHSIIYCAQLFVTRYPQQHAYFL